MGDDDHGPAEGVDSGSVDPRLDERSYPVTADERVERYGDRELERTNAAPIAIRERFGHVGDTPFDSED